MNEVYTDLENSTLSPKEIEDEGWKVEQVYPDGSIIFMLGNKDKGWELLYRNKPDGRIKMHRVWCSMEDTYLRDQVFRGECKNIETLKLITKLVKYD